MTYFIFVTTSFIVIALLLVTFRAYANLQAYLKSMDEQRNQNLT
jgi:hypothetical protein